jgi:hypothetical protein
MCSSSINQVKDLLRKNPEQAEWIKHRFKLLNSEACKCVIALLDLTDEESSTVEDVEGITFIKLKVGGVELISEFLLSRFITEWEEEFQHANFDPNCEEYLNLINGGATTRDAEVVIGECSPLFKLEKHHNLEHLTKYRLIQCDDEFETWQREEGSYVYFNVDIRKKEQLDKELLIPERIREILEEKQLEHLEKTAASVITDNLAYVYKIILKQQIPQHEINHSNVPRDSWGRDMYRVLGGNGRDDAYLGDGMSLDSNGRLID